MHLLNVVAGLQGSGIAANKDATWEQIEVVVLWRISGTLEHVQHLLSHQEATWTGTRKWQTCPQSETFYFFQMHIPFLR